MSQFNYNEFSQEITHRISADLFRQYMKQWVSCGNFDELREKIDSLKADFSCADQSLGAYGYKSHRPAYDVEKVLDEVELICDACEKILILTMYDVKYNVAKFCESNIEKMNELAEFEYSNLLVEIQCAKRENKILEDKVGRDNIIYSNLLEEYAEKVSQVEFLEDSYIETYAELCRSKWLPSWKNISGDLYEDYESAEAVCRVLEKAWENSSFIMCASYSTILLGLIEKANEEYNSNLYEGLDTKYINCIREKRNRIHNLLFHCSSRFQMLLGEE